MNRVQGMSNDFSQISVKVVGSAPVELKSAFFIPKVSANTPLH